MRCLSFLYHELRPEPSRYSYVVSCAEFKEHLRLYTESPEEASRERLRPQVTFDDGNLSDCRYALPLLQAAGLRAHFFITAGWTDERAGFMSAVELRTLHAAGMSVGAHGWSHKLLTSCSDVELRVELVDAKARLQDILGTSVDRISLPGGRYNKRILRACQEAGYTTVFTSEPAIHEDLQPSSAIETIGRLNLRSGTTTQWLEQVLHPGTGVLAKQQRADRVKGIAKSILGDGLYARAWALANRQEAEPADAEVIS